MDKKSNINSNYLKFCNDMGKFKDYKFDYEVANMVVEDEENYSKMHFYDKEAKQNSIINY